ncbi:MAG: exodeoxyribonuclease VII large subunit [Anaerolineae bacterium]|nr:exodeoxyribonuclease VII large subunit [Anaerolineae bacterium]
MTQASYSVSEITRYIKERLESAPLLQDVWVEGEISNWIRSRAGHCYFTLKDTRASIRGVIWRTTASGLAFEPEDGQAVLARGHVSVYEPQGQYQLYVDALQPVGRGALYLQFEELKERLGAEGLFDADRKRSLPEYPVLIGVVTSPTAAALQDILNVLRRRWPVAQVLLSPTLVQGVDAPPQIVAALNKLYAQAGVDVIIIARGGGSIEDLWAFNDERVARAIAEAPVPVISGVGHEVDFTIADFSADVRAPTPSAAAEVAVPDQAEIRGKVCTASTAATECVERHIRDARHELDMLRQSLARLSPRLRIQRDRQRVDDLYRRVGQIGQHHLLLMRERLSGMQHRLGVLDPHATLDRGYAVVRKLDGHVVRSVIQVTAGDPLSVQVSDGDFAARVEDSGGG